MRKINLETKRDKLKNIGFLNRVYNPMYYNVKPRYRAPMSKEESKFFKKALHQVYNPEVKTRFKLKDAGIINLFGET